MTARVNRPAAGRTWITAPPPPAVLSPQLRKLFAERTELVAKLDAANREVPNPFELSSLREAARRADVAAASLAVRADQPPPGTPAQDELAARIAAAQDQIDALSEAVTLVERDLYTAREAHRPRADEVAAKARAALVVAADALAVALADAVQAVGVAEWAMGASVFDPAHDVSLMALAPELASDAAFSYSGLDNGVAGVPADVILSALVNV